MAKQPKPHSDVPELERQWDLQQARLKAQQAKDEEIHRLIRERAQGPDRLSTILAAYDVLSELGAGNAAAVAAAARPPTGSVHEPAPPPPMNPAAIATSQPANAPARDMTNVNAAGPLPTLGDGLTSLPLLPLAPTPGWDGRTELRQGPRDKPPLAGSYRPDAEAPLLERLAHGVKITPQGKYNYLESVYGRGNVLMPNLDAFYVRKEPGGDSYRFNTKSGIGEIAERAGRLAPVFAVSGVAGGIGGGLALPLGALGGAVLRQHISDYLVPGDEGMTAEQRVDTVMREAALGLLRRGPTTVAVDTYNSRPYIDGVRNVLDGFIGPAEPRSRGRRKVWP